MQSKLLLATLALIMVAAATTPTSSNPTSSATTAPEKTRPIIAPAAVLSAAMAAKRQCSALFVSGRQFDEALAWSASAWLLPRAQAAYMDGTLRFKADAAGVSVIWLGREQRAVFKGDQGCVIVPEGASDVMFNPTPVRTKLPPANTVAWPQGDLEAVVTAPTLASIGIDPAELDAAVDLAFAEPADGTAALVVVHRGRIVAERYAAGAHQNMQLESWSMGKSLTSALVGVLIQQEMISLDTRMPVADWHNRADDPRAAITLRHVLNMSSGLQLSHPGARTPGALENSYVPGWADHSILYGLAVNAFDFCASRPLQFPVGTSGRYRNCDPLLAGYLLKETIKKMGEDYLTWPQKALFDRIGIRKQTMETDVYGNFVLTGFDYGTARNWARLGMLFLNRGEWLGAQIIPADFVDFVAAPAPAWPDGGYGGLFWRGHPASPHDSYSMRGGGGQLVLIIPSKNLVMVRMGHAKGFPLFDAREPQRRRDDALSKIARLF